MMSVTGRAAEDEENEHRTCRGRERDHPALPLLRSDKPAERDRADRSAKRSRGQDQAYRDAPPPSVFPSGAAHALGTL